MLRWCRVRPSALTSLKARRALATHSKPARQSRSPTQKKPAATTKPTPPQERIRYGPKYTPPAEAPSEPQPKSSRLFRITQRLKWRPSSNTLFLLHSLRRILTFLALYYTLFHYLLDFKPVRGPSMLPTLDVHGNGVIISLLHARGRFLHRGDLVSYRHPMHRDERAIKRVIGLAGDLVLRDTPGEGHGEGVLVRVPEGHCWVAGDNLNWSRDSRHFGPLPVALIRGRVLARYVPWRSRKWFGRGMDYVNVPELEDGVE